MSLFDDAKAIKEIQKIKTNGDTANLSISQITNLLINLPDAKRNLASDQFNKVYALYKEMRKCKTKLTLDMQGYFDTAIKIIKRFDKIAPYEKYSGGNEIEFQMMMDDLRAEEPYSIFDNISFNAEDKDYINYITKNSKGLMNRFDAEQIVKVMCIYDLYGKQTALKAFDECVNNLKEKYGFVELTGKISFMTGLLDSNNILSSEEADHLSQKYSDLLFEEEIQRK